MITFSAIMNEVLVTSELIVACASIISGLIQLHVHHIWSYPVACASYLVLSSGMCIISGLIHMVVEDRLRTSSEWNEDTNSLN
jgi:hypothetical protein